MIDFEGLTLQMLHFKTFKTTLLSAIFKQFGNCFGLLYNLPAQIEPVQDEL
jgi:hypothetical protein